MADQSLSAQPERGLSSAIEPDGASNCHTHRHVYSIIPTLCTNHHSPRFVFGFVFPVQNRWGTVIQPSLGVALGSVCISRTKQMGHGHSAQLGGSAGFGLYFPYNTKVGMYYTYPYVQYIRGAGKFMGSLAQVCTLHRYFANREVMCEQFVCSAHVCFSLVVPPQHQQQHGRKEKPIRAT